MFCTLIITAGRGGRGRSNSTGGRGYAGRNGGRGGNTNNNSNNTNNNGNDAYAEDYNNGANFLSEADANYLSYMAVQQM